MYEISKLFTFSASHRLDGLREGHQCGRLHGHNYDVAIVLAGPTLNETSFVKDYGELADFRALLDEKFEHRHLNDVLSFQPSAENMAKYFYTWAKGKWPEVVAARVSETPKTWAEYRPLARPSYEIELINSYLINEYLTSEAGRNLIRNLVKDLIKIQ